MMRVKKSDTQFNSTTNEKECENHCNRDCNNCQAYAYVEAETRADTAISMIWEENLNDIQEAYLDGGHDLYVRVAVSDIGTRAKENDKKRRIDGGCSSSKGIKFKMRQKQENNNKKKINKTDNNNKNKDGTYPPCLHCKKTNHPQRKCWWRPDVKCKKYG
ncbi:hypothetical protein VitviT2T_018017 [Vitis vinifera]|uniref:Apple domain-containing protein n=1 Tax=Vitis vinifera TaxID=29760 RepID=A0ABY9CW92_VITVI|nr:hypothetical protein VitviT2T_018017 [Vitis vinifera]